MTGDNSACGACGRLLGGTEPGTVRYCPHKRRTRRTRELTDEEREALEEAGPDALVADPVGRTA